MSLEFDGQRYRQTSTHQKEWGSRLIEELSLEEDDYILDVGCGDGDLTAGLAQIVPQGRVLGIDASAGMIEAARQHEGHNLKFRQLDVAEADLNEEFGLVFSNAALHWVFDHAALLEILHRSLRLDGRLRVNFAANGNYATFFCVVRGFMQDDRFRAAFEGFRWPWYMPTPAGYEALMEASRRPSLRGSSASARPTD